MKKTKVSQECHMTSMLCSECDKVRKEVAEEMVPHPEYRLHPAFTKFVIGHWAKMTCFTTKIINGSCNPYEKETCSLRKE